MKKLPDFDFPTVSPTGHIIRGKSAELAIVDTVGTYGRHSYPPASRLPSLTYAEFAGLEKRFMTMDLASGPDRMGMVTFDTRGYMNSIELTVPPMPKDIWPSKYADSDTRFTPGERKPLTKKQKAGRRKKTKQYKQARKLNRK